MLILLYPYGYSVVYPKESTNVNILKERINPNIEKYYITKIQKNQRSYFYYSIIKHENLST